MSATPVRPIPPSTWSWSTVIYRPDRGYDLAVGVVTPKPRLVRADGTTASSQSLCDDMQVVIGIEASIPAFGPPLGFTKAQYDAVLALGPPTHPALEPTVWYRFFNQQRLAVPFFKGTILEGNIATLPTALTSGLYATPANAYIYGYASRLLGPDPTGHNLIGPHAKMPTHATTFDRVAVSDSGGKQVRYWSICNYGAVVQDVGVGAVLMDGCLYDEQVPTDADGFYTIVVSLPEDRPANANAACGVAWLDWGKGDWLARPDLADLIIRNSSPIPRSPRASTRCWSPRPKKQALGDYYPTGRYMTRADFEARGCPGTGSPSGAFSDG